MLLDPRLQDECFNLETASKFLASRLKPAEGKTWNEAKKKKKQQQSSGWEIDS